MPVHSGTGADAPPAGAPDQAEHRPRDEEGAPRSRMSSSARPARGARASRPAGTGAPLAFVTPEGVAVEPDSAPAPDSALAAHTVAAWVHPTPSSAPFPAGFRKSAGAVGRTSSGRIMRQGSLIRTPSRMQSARAGKDGHFMVDWSVSAAQTPAESSSQAPDTEEKKGDPGGDGSGEGASQDGEAVGNDREGIMGRGAGSIPGGAPKTEPVTGAPAAGREQKRNDKESGGPGSLESAATASGSASTTGMSSKEAARRQKEAQIQREERTALLERVASWKETEAEREQRILRKEKRPDLLAIEEHPAMKDNPFALAEWTAARTAKRQGMAQARRQKKFEYGTLGKGDGEDSGEEEREKEKERVSRLIREEEERKMRDSAAVVVQVRMDGRASGWMDRWMT